LSKSKCTMNTAGSFFSTTTGGAAGSGLVSADWVSDLPLPDNVTVIGVKFTDDIGTVTIEAMDGKCVQYKVIDNEIAGQRQCGTADWANFVKK